MSERLITVAYFADYIEAELAKQLLENEGIAAFVMGQLGSAINVGVPGIADIQLQTPESQADEAMRILETGRQRAESEQETGEDAEQDGDEDLEQE